MITFYYEIPKLIDRAQIESLLYLQKVENKEGLPDFEVAAISDEDSAYIRKLLKNVANKIYADKLSPYSRLLSAMDPPLEGLEFEATYTDVENNETADCIIFRIIEPTMFDAVTMLPIENAIENALINYTVAEFLYRNGADGSMHKGLHESDMKDILMYITRRTQGKRTYKLF